MWQSRQWRKLLNLIDHLPRNSWYSQAVAGDEEYAKALAEAQVNLPKKDGDVDSGPPLVTFSPEVELLQVLVNEMRIMRAVFIQSKQEKGAPKVEPQLMSWPKTAMQRARAAAERARRKAKHEALVARVLPWKARQSDTMNGTD